MYRRHVCLQTQCAGAAPLGRTEQDRTGQVVAGSLRHGRLHPGLLLAVEGRPQHGQGQRKQLS